MGLHILFEIFRLGHHPTGSPRLSDVVLISIAFGANQTIKGGFSRSCDSQVGLSILDTREVRKVAPSQLISTYNFATGTPAYVKEAAAKFLFGATTTIYPSGMAGCITSLIPPNRNVVFVGHGIKADLDVLQSLNFEFPDLFSDIIDTSLVGQEIFGCRTLRRLLVSWDVPSAVFTALGMMHTSR